MRKKSLRILSLALATAMALSLANPGTLVQAASNKAVAENATAQDIMEAFGLGEAHIVSELSEGSVEGEQTQLAYSSNEVEEVEEVPIVEEVTEEAPVLQKKELNSVALLSTIMTDSTLLQMVVDAYNAGTGASLTSATITIGDLQNYEGVLDFSSVSGATAVTSVKGLGAAIKATEINISAFTNVTSIEAEEFMNCNFTTFQMPSTITNIGNCAFDGCKSLTSIILPDGLKVIGDEAFEDCTALQGIHTASAQNTLPTGLTAVGQKAFMGNVSLTEINLPSFTNGSVLEKAVGLFAGCLALNTITIGENVRIIPDSAFYSAGANGDGVTITFNSGLDKIVNKAFSGAKLVEGVGTIDLSMCTKLTGIAADAFFETQNLTTVIMPAQSGKVGSVEFGNNVFAKTDISSLCPEDVQVSGIYLPDYTYEKIGAGAFYGATNITKVSLPASLKELPDYIFDGCTGLAEVEQRGSSAVTLIGDCAFRSTAITNTDFMKNMPMLKQIGRQLHEKYVTDNTKLESLPLGGVNTTSKKYDVSDPTQKLFDNKNVGSEVFSYCYQLESITIPSNVEIIAQRAFYMPSGNISSALFTQISKLKSEVEQDENATATDVINAFKELTVKGLVDNALAMLVEKSVVESIVWESAASGITGKERKIYPEAFEGHGVNQQIILPQNSGETLSIGAGAFNCNTNVTRVGLADSTNNTLPNTVSHIGVGAFYYNVQLPEVHIQAVNGVAPTMGWQVFEGGWSLRVATLPSQTTVVPKHFFASCPLESFNFTELTELTKIDDLAFLGHHIPTVDLSRCTKLEELAACSLAFIDCLKKTYVKDYDVFTYYGNYDVQFSKLMLPDIVASTLHINMGAFHAQYDFETMGRKSNCLEGQIIVPVYTQQAAKAIFAYTSVSKVTWEADTDANAVDMRWKFLPEMTFEGCLNVTDIRDVMPMYVETIGKRAFSESGLQTADLTSYANLTAISTGTLDYSSQYEGSFAECALLTSVMLPTAGKEITVNKQSFKAALVLNNVDFGDAISLGQEAFKECISLTQIALKKVTDVGQSAFENCVNLKTVDFGSAQTIGNKAFYNCTSLVLTNSPLSDTIVSLGTNVFEGATSLGEVKFGAALTKIGNAAFKNSGATKFDFQKACALETIGTNAFENTLVTNFDMAGTKVAVVPTSMLLKCQSLTSAKFGEEVEYISQDALASCPKLKDFGFYASTTVSENVFKTVSTVDGVKLITGMNNGISSGSVNTVSITVATPEETVIPVGREMAFPYYVNEEGTSSISYLRVYDNNTATEDLTVDQYLSVRAKVDSWYYKETNSDIGGDTYKVSDAYFTKLDKADVMTLDNNKKVDVINVTGLKPTSENINFEIVANVAFTCDDGRIQSSVNATYNVKVVDSGAKIQLYQDQQLQTPIADGATYKLQSSSVNKGAQLYYYNLEEEISTGATIDNYNIMIESSNPDIVYAGVSASAAKSASYTTKATTINNGKYTTNANNKKFYLIPSGIGTAEVYVYPVDDNGVKQEAGKKTYTFTVNADVKNIALQVPTEYNGKHNPGNSFSVFKSYTNYFNQTCTVTDMSQFKNYTDRTIVFTSSDPSYVSVDQQGNVSILKADATAKQVTIKASVQNSDGKTVNSNTLTLSVKYPDVKGQTEIVDAATGCTILVTKVSKTDLQGEVTYTVPADASATVVTIPDTVNLYGVNYKVTAIADKAFKGNKKLKTVVIGKYIKKIGKEAFSGCTNLTKVTISNEVTEIGDKAFYNCKKLKTVKFGSKAALTTIGASAFAKCVKLTSITIPAKVKVIGASAFNGCKKLKKITIKSTVLTTVGKNAFKGIYKKATIKVPKKKLTVYKNLLKGKGQKSTVKIKK